MRVNEWSKEVSIVLYSIVNPSAHADGTDSVTNRASLITSRPLIKILRFFLQEMLQVALGVIDSASLRTIPGFVFQVRSHKRLRRTSNVYLQNQNQGGQSGAV